MTELARVAIICFGVGFILGYFIGYFKKKKDSAQ